ncbi:MAG: hypothetical protein ACP5R2_05085 [Anaerolineae bacterium]
MAESRLPTGLRINQALAGEMSRQLVTFHRSHNGWAVLVGVVVMAAVVAGGLALASFSVQAAAPRSLNVDSPASPDMIAATRVVTLYLPIISNDWPGSRSQWRFGFDVHIGRGQVTDYEVGLLRAGWYYDVTMRLNPAKPAGLEYMQTVRVAYPPQCVDLAPYVQNNRGSWWLIGNEPDRPTYQDAVPPDRYAGAYHDLYHCIKSYDSSAKVAAGGIVQPTPLRLKYLSMILESYCSRYRTKLPTDGWNIHNMILRERSCKYYPNDCWGAEVPTGLPDKQGMLYTIQDNDNMTYFKKQIEDMRRWMKQNGYQNMPLIVSEYGVNMPSMYGFDEQRVIRYMYNTFQYLLNARDCSLGYVQDGCRLVQRWAWYSLNDQMYVPPPACTGNDCGFNGNLFDPRTRKITAFGLAYRNRPYY